MGPGDKRTRFKPTDDEYDESVRGGCIGVSIQRGTIAPDDERCVLVHMFEVWLCTDHASDVGDAESAGGQTGTFERLPGPSGKKYFFEFRPLTEGIEPGQESESILTLM